MPDCSRIAGPFPDSCFRVAFPSASPPTGEHGPSGTWPKPRDSKDRVSFWIATDSNAAWIGVRDHAPRWSNRIQRWPSEDPKRPQIADCKTAANLGVPSSSRPPLAIGVGLVTYLIARPSSRGRTCSKDRSQIDRMGGSPFNRLPGVRSGSGLPWCRRALPEVGGRVQGLVPYRYGPPRLPWSGCAGRPGSSARTAATREAGGSAMVGSRVSAAAGAGDWPLPDRLEAMLHPLWSVLVRPGGIV